MPLAASSSGSSSLTLLIFVIFILGMYFLLVRPQQRRNRQTQEMQSRLGVGDEVMTGSGIYGTVAAIDEEDGTVLLEISEDVTIKLARGAIAKVVAQNTDDEPGDGEEYEAEDGEEYEAEDELETEDAGEEPEAGTEDDGGTPPATEDSKQAPQVIKRRD